MSNSTKRRIAGAFVTRHVAGVSTANSEAGRMTAREKRDIVKRIEAQLAKAKQPVIYDEKGPLLNLRGWKTL